MFVHIHACMRCVSPLRSFSTCICDDFVKVADSSAINRLEETGFVIGLLVSPLDFPLFNFIS